MTIQQAYQQSKGTPILHRCNYINSEWRHCFNLSNRLMLGDRYVSDDYECSWCHSYNSLIPVQSYLGEEYHDILASKRNPVNKEESHIILFINVNGKQPRYKGRFVKVIGYLDRMDSFNLHIQFSKIGDIVEVVDYQ